MTSVTAIIPCYNAAAFLAEAIESVKAQTVAVAEVLVVDDASTDGSAEIARAAGARVLSTGGQRGPATARNAGVREAATPYIAFLDADDLWFPRHCESLLALLQAAPDAAVAFGRIQRFGPAGDLPTSYRTGIRNEGHLPELLLDNPIAQSATIVRRAAFLEVGGYQDGLRHAEDFDLWLRLAERFPILASNTVTCRYRIHSGQATLALSSMLQGTWKARTASRERLKARGAYRAEHEQMLLQALREDIQTAWVLADRVSLAQLLRLTTSIEGGSRLRSEVRAKLAMAPLRRLALAARGLAQGRFPGIKGQTEP